LQNQLKKICKLEKSKNLKKENEILEKVYLQMLAYLNELRMLARYSITQILNFKTLLS